MDDTLYINGLPIQFGDVTKWPTISESISYDWSLNIPDSYSFELTNTSPNKYDPKYPGSILNGTQVIKMPVSIFDGNLNQITMRGVIKNVSTDSGTGKITIECTSQLSAIVDNDVQIIKTNQTPADIVYAMLTAPKTQGTTISLIDPSFIDFTSYRYASIAQAANKCYVNISVLKGGDNNKKYSDLIPELNKIGQMYVYAHYDKIYFWQYATSKTISFIINSYKAGSYKDYYSQDDAYKIRNSCSIIYQVGASVAYYINKNLNSINQYGESIFGIPSDEVNSNNSADYSAIITSHAGAKWVGDTAISRFLKSTFMCEFIEPYSQYYFLKVGDIVGLNFDAFSNTPAQILSAEYDKYANTIKFVCLFL